MFQLCTNLCLINANGRYLFFFSPKFLSIDATSNILVNKNVIDSVFSCSMLEKIELLMLLQLIKGINTVKKQGTVFKTCQLHMQISKTVL